MDPINYNIDVQNPFESALKGYQVGLAMKQQQAQLQMQQDLAKLATNPDAGAQDYASMMVRYPQLSEHFKRSWDVLSADQQQSKLSQATQVYSALQTGNNDVAVDLLNKQAQAYRNAGKDQPAKDAETMAKLIQMRPDVAKTSAALGLSAILGPDKFATTFATLGDQQRAQELQPGKVALGNAEATIKQAEARNTPQRLALESQLKGAQIRDIDSNIATRAGQLGLDRDKLQSEVEMKLYELGQKNNQLDDGAKKIINDSTVGAVAATQASGQMLDLATRLEKQGGGYGAFSTASEWLKGATGNQDVVTQIRQEYARIRNNQALKMLPPGPASDKDIAMAMQGFPKETADAATMASFLRGMAKLNQYTAATENAKSEWVNAVGHLGKPKQDINVGGVNVPAGTTFADFASKYVGQQAGQLGVQQGQAQVPQRSYMKYATPGAQ